MSTRAAAAVALVATAAVAVISIYRHGLVDALSALAILACLASAYLASRVSQRPEPAPSRSERTGPDRGAWVRLVEEDVDLIDELDRHRAELDPSGRALADHVTARLEEVLLRAGVEVIEADTRFDRLRHAPLGSGADSKPGAAIAEVVSPGFAIGRRVLRRAQVRLRS